MSEERNKKLAEWAGIEPEEIEVSITGVFLLDGTEHKGGKRKEYIYPDFDFSLDAIFEWLVPLVDDWYVSKSHNTVGWARAGVRRIKGGHAYHDWFVAEAETPALALCKAIEQLIDEEQVKGGAK